MNLRFPRLFTRAQHARPATVQVHTDEAVLPPWLNRRAVDGWPPQPELSYYAPKRPPLDIETCLVVSLSREKQLRLSRIVRHGYQVNRMATASNVVPLRMAA